MANTTPSVRRAVITGGTGNLGRVVVDRFLQEGYHVHVPWHSESGWDELQDMVDPALSEHLRGSQTDMSDEPSVRDFMREVASQSGRLTALLNLVGGFAFGSKLWEMDLSTWQKMLTLNLTTAFLSCKHAIPQMREAPAAHIINVSSKAAVDLQPGSSAYAVAKSGIVTMTRALREELKSSNISVNAIMPAIIDTPATRNMMPEANQNKWVDPSDIAETLVTVSSGRCDALTGCVLRMFGDM